MKVGYTIAVRGGGFGFCAGKEKPQFIVVMFVENLHDGWNDGWVWIVEGVLQNVITHLRVLVTARDS